MPYWNVTDPDAHNMAWAFEPTLGFGDRCAPLPFDSLLNVPREADILATSDFVEFAYRIRMLHVGTLCWLSAMSYISTDFCSSPQTTDVLEQYNVAFKGNGSGPTSAADLRARVGHACDCGGNESATLPASCADSSETTGYLNIGAGDDAPLVFVFHMRGPRGADGAAPCCFASPSLSRRAAADP